MAFGNHRPGDEVELDASSEQDMKALEIWEANGWSKSVRSPVRDKALKAPESDKAAEAPYGYTKDGRPKKRPGRQPKAK